MLRRRLILQGVFWIRGYLTLALAALFAWLETMMGAAH